MGMKRFALLLCAEDSEYVKMKYGGYFGVFVRMLGEEGEAWDRFRVAAGEFPADDQIADYDGFVISGSCNDAHGDDPWICRLIALLQRLASLNKRILGICFGHQILGRALGGKTGRGRSGWDIGITTVHVSSSYKLFSSLKIPTTLSVIECHRDEIYELPSKAEVIGRSDKYGIEMFKYGDHILGIQGHPEYTKDILLHLIDRLVLRKLITDEFAEEMRSNVEEGEADREAWKRLCIQGMQDQASSTTSPSPDDMFTPTKKNRASTGFALRSRAVNFVSGGNHLSVDSARHPNSRRRASSADFSQQQPQPEQVNPEHPLHMDRTFWGLPAESGTGVKARRMSLSLPDDFTVDIGDLESEFEYQHKFLGRRGKHIGKGATSKVTLMVRKGSPNELYAVKEFRGKSSRETHEEYDKKVKSEYTLAKSLQHPNIVETVRLCRDHGRWNHVMEYCSEGDMFTLVNKKYLKAEDRDKDRQCLFKQLIQGIHYLHSNGIAHRDIKLENLLITEDSKLKITDFGVSEVFSGIHPGLREAGGQCGINMGEVRLCSPGICGSEPYIAPEVLDKTSKYDPRALDIWGAGIVMVHLIFGGALWTRAQVNSNENNKFYAALARGWERWNAKHADAEATISELDYPKFMPFDVAVKPPALRRILLQMLNPNPAKRISSADIMNNRWFKNIECCQLESDEAPTHMIDAANMQTLNRGRQRKVFCHNHLPQKDFGTHSLGKMPGSVGY